MNVRVLISLHEGRVRHAYQDSLGFWTIGVGHLIDERKGGGLPDSIIDALLELDIHEHTNELFASLPWVRDLDPVRQAVLIDMYFNMRRKLLGFKETLRQFQAGNWDAASAAMLDSVWAKQVGTRALRLSEMTRTGEWPTD
jgi:lysozyme